MNKDGDGLRVLAGFTVGPLLGSHAGTPLFSLPKPGKLKLGILGTIDEITFIGPLLAVG